MIFNIQYCFFNNIKFLVIAIWMDTMRTQQINEILNYDRNINLRALALQRKQVANWGTDGGETGELVNQDVIDASNSLVNSLFVLLDKRRADIKHYISMGLQWER